MEKMKTRYKLRKASESKRSKSEKIVYAVFFILMMLLCVAIIYIYLYGFNASLKENGRVFVHDPNSFASELCFSNYVKAFKEMTVNKNSYFMMTFNSIWYSVGGTLFSLSVAACSTYIVARFKNKFTKAIFNICILVMIFPVVGAAPALYRLYHNLHMDQTPLILLSGLNNMCNLIMYAFFSALPQTYAEAAYIDGANEFQVFFRIIFPMLKPTMITSAVLNVLWIWNDYLLPYLVIGGDYRTIPIAVQYLKGGYGSVDMGAMMGCLVLAIIPIVVFYLFCQKHIIAGVTAGAVKG